MALAPRSASVAFMILSTRSSATSSDSDSGPTGMPAIFAVFSIIAGGTPSISISQALGGEAQHAAVGEEAAGVVDHDRRLADHAHIIERGGERDVAGVLADDDLHQHHLLDRREEMNADELALVLELFAPAN